MSYRLKDKVFVMTEFGRRDGWVRGRAFDAPRRYDVQTEKGLVRDVPEDQLKAAG